MLTSRCVCVVCVMTSLQDLKDRFYSIQVKLLKLRAPPSADISAHPLMQAPYDKGQ